MRERKGEKRNDEKDMVKCGSKEESRRLKKINRPHKEEKNKNEQLVDRCG